CYIIFFFPLLLLPPTLTLFPYTTLFRSTKIINRRGHTQRIDLVENFNGTVAVLHQDAFSQLQLEVLRRQSGLRQNLLQRTQETRSEEHTSELQSRENLVCRLLLEKKKKN